MKDTRKEIPMSSKARFKTITILGRGFVLLSTLFKTVLNHKIKRRLLQNLSLK